MWWYCDGGFGASGSTSRTGGKPQSGGTIERFDTSEVSSSSSGGGDAYGRMGGDDKGFNG